MVWKIGCQDRELVRVLHRIARALLHPRAILTSGNVDSLAVRSPFVSDRLFGVSRFLPLFPSAWFRLRPGCSTLMPCRPFSCLAITQLSPTRVFEPPSNARMRSSQATFSRCHCQTDHNRSCFLVRIRCLDDVAVVVDLFSAALVCFQLL